ncbi:MAG: serine/threonine-protein kinase [Gemmatimonadaceae bacterium]
MSSGPTPIAGFCPAPGSTAASLSFTLGTNIGAGQGMNSEVFLAHDHQLDSQVVIKKVPKSSLSSVSSYFGEARRLYDSRHRHVAEVKYACEDTDHIYLAMPFYRGGSLESKMDGRHLTVREIVRYGLEFLSGLHHVHVRGLVHLDVKPTNVLLDDADTAALADFGLSREVTSTGLADMPMVYIPHQPPERVASTLVTKSADVYQAAITLYRMCSGGAEFDRQLRQYTSRTEVGAAILRGTFPDRSRFLPHVPARLRTLIRAGLQTDPAQRLETVLALMNALAQVDSSLDWSYEQEAEWGVGTWRESGYGRGRRVQLVRAAATWTVISKRTSATGREASVTNLCGSNLDHSAAKRLVKSALTERWG